MFTKNCRICLSDESDNVIQLFATEQNDGTSPSETGQMYLDCLQLELIDNGAFPQHICNYCKLQLSLFHIFRIMAKKSFDKFKNKSEPVIKSNQFYQNCSDLKDFDDYSDLDAEDEEDEHMDDGVLSYLDDDDTDNGEQLEDDIFSCDCDDNIGQEFEPDKDLNFEVNIGGTIINNVTGDLPKDDKDDFMLERPSGVNTDNCVLECPTALCEDEIVNQDVRKECAVNCATGTPNICERPKDKLECELCHKKFKSQALYQSHLNNGMHNVFKCEICDKTFNFRFDYKTHLLLHTNDRPYKCDICHKGFRTKSNLNTHSGVHDDIGKYECKICGRRFRMSGNLTAHRYTHNNENHYECDLCHRKYKTPRSLRRHLNRELKVHKRIKTTRNSVEL